jgi:hypothetical protein
VSDRGWTVVPEPERNEEQGDGQDSRREPDPAADAERLRRAVREGAVAPRDASLWAGLAGLKALPESKANAQILHGVGPRQARKIERSVAETLVGLDDPPVDPAQPSLNEDRPFALTAAEIALSAHPHLQDGERALGTLRSLERGEPVGRGGAGRPPTPTRDRVRQRRYRPQLAARVKALAEDPTRSVGQPYLVVPAVPPPTLAHLVPVEQRRRGRPPDVDWLATQVDRLRSAYANRDPTSRDLAKVLVWGFSRYPASPAPEVEAAGLRVVATIAREHGSMATYWFVERIGHLLGPSNIESLYAVHDAVIVLRNHGYQDAAKALLDWAVQVVPEAPMEEQEKPLLLCVLLGLSAYFFSGPHRLVEVAEARRDVLRLCASADALGTTSWTPPALRAAFEVEFTHARLRARRDHERLWLHDAAEAALHDADHAMTTTSESIWRAQWALLRMQLGLLRRDNDEVMVAAATFWATLADNPWIARDMPSEAAQYEQYRRATVARNPRLDGRLAPITELTST